MPPRPDGDPLDPQKTKPDARVGTVRLERRRYYQNKRPARFIFTDWASI